MKHIIETVGEWGIETTPAKGYRLQVPRPGDVVDFGQNREYPFDLARYGRVEMVEEDSVGVCCDGGGSVFLMKTGQVSISGGPFVRIFLHELVPTLELKMVTFWNWGDNRPGAGQAVDYLIERPVFRLRARESPGVFVHTTGR